MRPGESASATSGPTDDERITCSCRVAGA